MNETGTNTEAITSVMEIIAELISLMASIEAVRAS